MTVGLFKDIEEDLNQVYMLMLEELKSDQSFLNQLISYLLQKRGKMIRPALVILAGRMCGNSSTELCALGASMEILHMATLIHDDIVDEAAFRRGMSTVNKTFNNQIAVLLGDFFYAKSLNVLSRIPNHGFELVAEIVSNLVQGEFLQYEYSFKKDQGMDRYWQMIMCKTAYFIASCCRLGALVSSSSIEERDSLTLYGQKLGMAFQICDDLLDFDLEAKKLGKPIFKDVSNGIYTLPIIHALGNSQNQKALRDLLSKDQLHFQEYHLLINILNEEGSLDYARQIAENLSKEAREHLMIFPDSQEKGILESLTRFNTKRDF